MTTLLRTILRRGVQAAVGLSAIGFGAFASEDALSTQNQIQSPDLQLIEAAPQTDSSKLRIQIGGENVRFLKTWFPDHRLAGLRAIRAIDAAARMGALYTFEDIYPTRSRSELHTKCASILKESLLKNGGMYIKLGQMLSQLQILPREYSTTLRCLLSDCYARPFSDVESVLRTELGTKVKPGTDPINEIFEWVSHEPVAVASLASVHQAKLKPSFHGSAHNGMLVALKVQHKDLAYHSNFDIKLTKGLLWIGASLFPFVKKLQWLGAELETSLPRELDFQQEAVNMSKCAENIAKSTNPIVRNFCTTPTAYNDLSTGRLLVMTWESGVSIGDIHGIQKQGLSTKQISTILNEFFADQIFMQKFVHCDPHLSNVLVRAKEPRDSANGKGLWDTFWSWIGPKRVEPMLVILDHGLYRTLSEDFVVSFARLWNGIIYGDVKLIRASAAELGISDQSSVETLTAMLTLKSWDLVSGKQRPINDETRKEEDGLAHLHMPGDSEQDRQRMTDYASKYANEISEILGRIPRQLLLLFKTYDCLRSIDRVLNHPASFIHATARASQAVIDRLNTQSAISKYQGHSSMDWVLEAGSWIWREFLNVYRTLRLRIIEMIFF